MLQYLRESEKVEGKQTILSIGLLHNKSNICFLVIIVIPVIDVQIIS